MRRRLIHMQRHRQSPVAQRHHHLDHTSHTRSRLRMTDVGFDRPQPQRTVLRTVLAIRRQQRLRLNRVAQSRPRAVRLHHIHVTGTETRIRQRLPDHPLLRRTIRRGQTVRRTVLVDRRATHHRQHPMTVRHRIRQPLQQQQPHTFTPARAIRRRRKRLAPPINRQPPLPTELHKSTRRRHHRHPTRQRQRTLPRPQRLRRQMQRHQRRRTRRIHRHRRPLKTKHIRQPPRHHTSGGTGQEVAVGGVRLAAVPLEAGPHEHAGRATAERGQVQARAFEQFPRRLQQQPLLRIHRQRLTRTDAEQFGVEVGGVLDETAFAGVGLARPAGHRVVQRVQIPAPVRRELRDRVRSVRHQFPQVLGAVHAARQPAAHSHNGYRFVLTGLVSQEPFPGLLQLTGHALEVLEQLVLVCHHNLNRRSRTG